MDEFFVRATSSAGYRSLAAGPDGKLWFLETGGPVALARMDPRRLVELRALPSGSNSATVTEIVPGRDVAP